MHIINIDDVAKELGIDVWNGYTDDIPLEIDKLFEEERKKLGLEGKNISLMIPLDKQGRDIRNQTSFVRNEYSTKKNRRYVIYLHHLHVVDNSVAKFTIRHELHHIWNRDLDRFGFLPDWLHIPVVKIYEWIFDVEGKANMYGYQEFSEDERYELVDKVNASFHPSAMIKNHKV